MSAPCQDQQDQADDRGCAPIKGPLALPRHEAAGQDTDSLQKPGAARKQEQETCDIQSDPHRSFVCVIVCRAEAFSSSSTAFQMARKALGPRYCLENS